MPGLPTLHVGVVHIEEHVLARYFRLQLGADEEGASHLAVEGVGLLRWRGEAVAEHDRDEALNALSSALSAEVEGLGGCEGFTENHHRFHVSICEGLSWSRKKNYSRHVNVRALSMHDILDCIYNYMRFL